MNTPISFISVPNRSVFNACLILVSSTLVLPVHAEISLDKLNACDEVAELYSSLKAGQFAGSECRTPSDALEKALISRTGGLHSKVCLLSFSPSPILDGFTCFQTLPDGKNLTCYGPARLADIDTWKEQYGEEQYEELATSESNYLKAAGNCRASNGDTSKAAATTASPLLGYISHFKIGWISALGSMRPVADSSIVHGYASTDTSLPRDAPSAIEFIYMFADAPKYSSTAVEKKVGNWIVHIDAAKEAEDYLQQELRRYKTPLRMDFTFVELESTAATTVSMSSKKSILARLQEAIGDSMEEEDFKKMSDSELEKYTGKDSKGIIDLVMKHMPAGAPIKLKMGNISAFVNERRPSCVKGGRGAMGFYMMSTEPVPEVRKDYGSIVFIVVGAGNCSRASASTRTYINGLIEEATNQVLSNLQRIGL